MLVVGNGGGGGGGAVLTTISTIIPNHHILETLKEKVMSCWAPSHVGRPPKTFQEGPQKPVSIINPETVPVGNNLRDVKHHQTLNSTSFFLRFVDFSL